MDLLSLKILKGLWFQGVVFVETLLIYFLVANFLYQEFLELHFRADQFLFYVSENTRIDDSIGSQQRYFMLLFIYHGTDSVRSGINLLQIILILFDFSLQRLDILKIWVSDRTRLCFSFIVHSTSYRTNYGIKFQLN